MRNANITIDFRTEKEKMNEAFGYEKQSQAEWYGKRSGYAKAVNGFSIVQLSNDRYQWLPFGQPAMLNGERDHRAKLVSVFYWNGRNWKQR